jgi:hypothetical protein
MLFAWLLPDASYVVLFEDWRRRPYLARHGKPPLLARAVRSVAGAVSVVGERYTGPDGSDGLPSEVHPAS